MFGGVGPLPEPLSPPPPGGAPHGLPPLPLKSSTMTIYIMSLTGKTSYDESMNDENTGHNEALKKKIGGKTFEKKPIIGTKYTIAISSAKGGVGKSTFASNIALALKKIGCKVGLLDADIYGPSLPKLFSINEKPKSDGKTLNPILK